MFKEKLKRFLNDLVNINIKDDSFTIQLRSLLKIYTIFGIVAHFLIFLIFLLDKEYLCALFTLLYWIILVVLMRIGDFIKVRISELVILISTFIYCTVFCFVLGANAKFDIYLFLLVPVLATTFDKSKYKTRIMFAICGLFYIFGCGLFIYTLPLTYISNRAMAFVSLVNGIYVFITMLTHTLICNIYNDSTINKLQEDKKTLDKDSKIDHLTGLYNRRSMEKYLNTLEDQYRITNKAFGLILFDIDFFKKVNDTYGHQSGDKVLAEISRLIVYSLRKSDEVFRYGGEEILAIVTGIQSKDELIKVANGIREDIASLKIPCDENDISVTISAGCTLYDGSEVDHVIKKVDEALYAAKNNGRNRIEYLQ